MYDTAVQDYLRFLSKHNRFLVNSYSAILAFVDCKDRSELQHIVYEMWLGDSNAYATVLELYISSARESVSFVENADVYKAPEELRVKALRVCQSISYAFSYVAKYFMHLYNLVREIDHFFVRYEQQQPNVPLSKEKDQFVQKILSGLNVCGKLVNSIGKTSTTDMVEELHLSIEKLQRMSNDMHRIVPKGTGSPQVEQHVFVYVHKLTCSGIHREFEPYMKFDILD
jgi:hypothetical protein